MHHACSNGNLKFLKYINENPNFEIDFNVVDHFGWTPLREACDEGQFKIVKFLLEISKEKGIDIEKKDNYQETPKDLAKQEGHNDIVELLDMWFYATKQVRELKRKYDIAFA